MVKIMFGKHRDRWMLMRCCWLVRGQASGWLRRCALSSRLGYTGERQVGRAGEREMAERHGEHQAGQAGENRAGWAGDMVELSALTGKRHARARVSDELDWEWHSENVSPDRTTEVIAGRLGMRMSPKQAISGEWPGRGISSAEWLEGEQWKVSVALTKTGGVFRWPVTGEMVNDTGRSLVDHT